MMNKHSFLLFIIHHPHYHFLHPVILSIPVKISSQRDGGAEPPCTYSSRLSQWRR